VDVGLKLELSASWGFALCTTSEKQRGRVFVGFVSVSACAVFHCVGVVAFRL